MPACCIQFSDVRILHDIHFQSLVTGVIAAGGVSSATIQPGDYCVSGAGYSAVATTTVNDCYIAEPEVRQCRCAPAVACARSVASVRASSLVRARFRYARGTLCVLFVGRCWAPATDVPFRGAAWQNWSLTQSYAQPCYSPVGSVVFVPHAPHARSLSPTFS